MFKNKTLVKQDGFKDCGPACLLMIIKHYKGYLDIEELKLMCKNDNKGTTAYHLIEAAKICGFEASGVRCELKDINASNIILPCIAHITIDNSYNHYVVIDKIDFKKKRLLIKDPIGKISYYTYDEFNKIFNNILITLYPIKPIPLMQKNSYGIFIKNILSSSKKELLQVIIISIFITIFSIITTFYLQNMIDNVNTTKNKIYFIFIIFLILYIFKIVSDFLRNQIIILINQKVDLELTDKTFKQMILLPYYYYRNHTTGEIISRISDLEAVRQVISKVAISIFIDLPLTIIALIVMYIMNTTLFIISIVIMLLYLLIGLIFKQPFNNYVDSCQRKKASATSYMVESINGFESVKGCNIEKSIINNFENKYVDMSNEIFKFDHCYNYQYLLKEIINNIGFIAIILVGILLVFDNKITLGNLLSFNALLAYFLEPIRNIMDLDTSVKQALNAIKRVLKMFYVKSNTSIINKPMQGDIIIKDLTYSFDDVHNVLNNINLKINKGNKTLIIGNSGGGKSTLLKILKKYYNVKRDKVLIDNIDLNDYEKSDIIYISQNEILFTDTIYNNIGSDNILNVSKMCMLDVIIKDNPLGYNMLIEENGFNISGGEKQRIVLARAISKPFNILIIDEGLNQVDINMERKILKNLFVKYKDKTIIIISHRLDNMDLFNQVIKIEEGRVLEDVSKNKCHS